MLGLLIIGISGFILLKKMLIVEVGSILFFVGLIWELYGTKKGLWNYEPSPFYTIAGRVPIETLLSYFFLGMVAASYIIFRLVM
jgi:uncharacterized membrane protein YoaT (DUF817 family)